MSTRRTLQDALKIALTLANTSGRKETIEHVVETQFGELLILADLSVANNKVVFSDLCIYLFNDQPSVRGLLGKVLLRELRRLLDALKVLGYAEFELRAWRAAHSSAARPNREVLNGGI